MFEVAETNHLFFSNEMQKFISAECQKPNKQWIYDIVAGNREKSSVLYRDKQNRFLILPNKGEPDKKKNGYIAIFADKTLRSIRDLRSEHIPLILDVCTAGLDTLPSKFSHVSFHYHPSVYQLHMHFRKPKEVEKNNWRIIPTPFVLFCLSVKGDFFSHATLRLKLHHDSHLCQTIQKAQGSEVNTVDRLVT